MRILTISLAICLLTVSFSNCGKHDATVDPNACTLAEPIINTTWVQQLISSTDCVMFGGAEVYSCTYNAKTCIYVDNEASSQGVCTEQLYDCKGTKMLDGASPKASWDDFKKNVTNKVKIWSK